MNRAEAPWPGVTAGEVLGHDSGAAGGLRPFGDIGRQGPMREGLSAR
jgi:hypothetical protein